MISQVRTVIAACGITTYDHKVLVPEAAMLLVKEAMIIGDNDALRILEESTQIREILNKREDDQIDCYGSVAVCMQ